MKHILALLAPATWRNVWVDRDVLQVQRSSKDRDRFLVTFPSLARFDIDTRAKSILAERTAPDLSQNSFNHLLADQVLPRIVSHDGNLVVHAAGVATSSGAILLVGLSGRGKSTLSASFHAHGNPLLGDDAMIVDFEEGSARCRPLYRSLRLFPDSIDAVFDGSRRYAPVADYTSKRNIIDLEPADLEDKGMPIRSVFLLGAEDNENSVRPAGAREACMAILQQSFALDPADRERSERRLEQIAKLVGAVPVFELLFQRTFASLPEVRKMVLST